ncbi:MAG: tRNA (adenosine(37)-N6)-threonylcarbamoyltransferase complex dimerization subunit type 1 TsaB [Phycisphaerae bacterium]|nr:tRNA (adenosine(37)-N6)-threonylcarbamoyltransferase complex dimerization subunit type 1 TsaB [Phycisphaerae bacterium]
MADSVSIAIETSCGTGGVALGRGDALLRAVPFDASARHATHLLNELDALLDDENLAPDALDAVYVSVGPGSFTGLRVGVTVARTLAQAVPNLRCVAVPTAAAVAENVRDLPWNHLTVVFDAKGDRVYVQRFGRNGETITADGKATTCTEADFLAAAPRPILLTGEGLDYHDLTGEGVTIAPRERWLPTAEGAWRAGRRLAEAERFTPYLRLLPTYARRPEAVRLWERSGRPDRPAPGAPRDA